MIGEVLSPILCEIEQKLTQFALVNSNVKPEYTDEALRASLQIFMSVLLDKMYSLQEDEQIDIDTRMDMATKSGEELRKIVKTYTGIDTHDMYK